MRKIIVVAMREYQAAVRTKAFIISLVAMPILFGGGIVAQVFLHDKVDIQDHKIAVVDRAGVLFDAIAAAARRRNETEIYRDADGADRKQIKPRFLFEKIEPTTDDDDELKFQLSEKVRRKEYFAFIVIPKDVLEPNDEPGGVRQIDYHSNTPTFDDLRDWLAPVVRHEVQQLRFAREGLNPTIVAKATQWVNVDNLTLVSRDESGGITKAERSNELANLAVPAGMMMLMLMVVMVSASPLVQSVLEEKMQRIAEVLLGSVPPFHLMMGKLLGTVGVSLTISTVYLVGAYVALRYSGLAAMFPRNLVWWFVLYQALAVLMYGSLFISVGAAVTDMKESQSLLTPVMVLVMAPVFVWGNVLKAPSATFAVAVSLFPPATPILMLLRQAIPPGVPLWQPLLGIALVLVTTVLFVFAAGRIFRVGILMQGKGAKFGQMLRWAFRG